MRYEISGGALPVAICHLEAGEGMVADPAALGWMTSNVVMSANAGGAQKGGRRSDAGCAFRCTEGVGMVAFPSSFPGAILPFHLAPGESVLCQRDAFLCAQSTVSTPVFWEKRMPGWPGGFVLQRLIGPGIALLVVDGVSIEYDLGTGERMKADAAHVCAMDFTVSLDIASDAKTLGVCLTELMGPGRVWLQSMPVPRLAGRMATAFRR